MTINRKYILFGSLYFSQFIPLGFFTESLPVYLRSLGYSLQIVGMIHMLLLPWMVKFLWAPAVDKIGSKKPGHYRYWILIMQGLVFLCLVASAFVNLSTTLYAVLICIALLSFFSSTQDIATDAFAVETLKKSEQGFGNSIQNSAHSLGSLIGGGLMLLFLNQIGWSGSIFILAGIVLIPCIILIINWNKYPVESHAVNNDEPKKSVFDFFKRKGNLKWLGILLLLPLGSAISDFIFKPFLIDAGYSLEDIGFMRGIIGLIASFAGAIFGGFLIKDNNRNSLLIKLGLLLSLTMLLYILPIYAKLDFWSITSIIIINRFIYGAFVTLIFTLIMQRCEKGKAGTDFSVQIAVMTFSSHGINSLIAGFLTPVIGYTFIYVLASGIAITSIIIYRRTITSFKAAKIENLPDKTLIPKLENFEY
ncbi:MAG TPA: MFS transporter [Ignavibacteria bacterium]|nr:MFS transporter [Ignavibacteria bacterium]